VVAQVSKKVCLLGSFAVGKTSLVRRFVYDLFDDNYLSKVGVKVSRKALALPLGEERVDLTMMLWDMDGRDEFRCVRASYQRGAAAAVLVCDLTHPESLEALRVFVEDVRSISPGARLIVAANKRDLTDQVRITAKQAASFAASLGTACYLTSAKTGEGVENLFRYLGSLLLG
jgi:small GTP-binding protein